MKKVGLLLMIIFACLDLCAADKSKGEIKFVDTVYDFGNIKEDGGPVTCEFKYTNVGKDPVKIISAKAECGCTTPEITDENILPDESGIIKVKYNPLGRPGGFTKVVTVKCTGNPGRVFLKIRGTVVPKNPPVE